MNRPASFISVIFLLAVAFGHVLRILFGVEVIANGFNIPMWPSIVAAVFTATLALLLLKERRVVSG